MSHRIRLGLCPMGKVLFSHEDACLQKRAIQAKLGALGVDFVDLDDVLPASDGLVREIAQCEAAIEHFRRQRIDALFLPHCNFGTEGAAGIIAREARVPVLLWGPRDDAPNADGSRLRDSLCGMLASSKVIRKLTGGRFTYIENCRIDDAAFASGLDTFLRASAVVKAVRHMRIGLLGARIDFFWSCIVNEAELLERFGIEVLPFEIGAALEAMRAELRDNGDACRAELDALQASWLDATGMADAELLRGVALSHVLRALRDEHGLSAMAVQNFFSLSDAIGPGGSLFVPLANEFMPLADESDIHGAVGLAMMEAARTTADRVFFPEYVVRHPTEENTVCMWHVGAPPSLRDPGCARVAFRAPWILPGDTPSQAQMKLKNGPLTVCRFDGDAGRYRLGVGQGELVDGPYTRDYYGWLRVDDWPRWERQIIMGPYIHHCAAAYGHCADALIEASRYLDLDLEVYGDAQDAKAYTGRA